MIENNIDGELTYKKQYEKMGRALRIVLNIKCLTPDEYCAIMQLMNDLPEKTVLVLDETCEDL